ncbi:PIN domain-containing protein [Scytonema hofmannii PCC 7110]|uniref:PIN domain-containing protein n=1 Tax=Scytonema hofmannii PCC 7110 TaxID=128403 RepID=A0A139XFZ8_9CYAN|nr:PIN domain-containing protein [Scytonema hofmannii]KYC43601.1 PIN domain-containing protein [Scytonema hofmannii PCC 7110]
MSNLTVVYDACVLYPAALRDFLVWLALTNLFHARWTDEIHDEWTRNVLKNRPDLTKKQLERTKNLMNSSVPNCLVTGYESIIPDLQLPDPDDRHILAAAIHCRANIIVSFNLSDFLAKVLNLYRIEAQSPDNFILNLLNQNFTVVCEAAQRQRKTLKNPPKTVEEYLETLKQQGLALTATRLREVCQEI